jgi:phage antirepressor YoqD-like protein
MNKIYPFIICWLFFVLGFTASCGESNKEKSQREMIDSLENVNFQLRMNHEDLQRYLTVIAEGLDSIAIEEKELLIAQNKQQEELLTIQAPKVDLYEDFISTEYLYSVGDIAKTLAIKNMGKNNLYKYLRWNKIFMDKYEAYQRYVKSGHVVHRNRTYTYGKDENAKTVKEICAYFTPKGVEYLYKKLKKDGYSTKKSLQQVVDELNVVTE